LTFRLGKRGRLMQAKNRVEMMRYTRRNFIKRTVAAAGTAGFAAGCRRLQLTDRADLSSGAIDGLRAKLKGRLIVPTIPHMKARGGSFIGTQQRSEGRWSSCNARARRMRCEPWSLRGVMHWKWQRARAGTVTWDGDVRTAWSS